MSVQTTMMPWLHLSSLVSARGAASIGQRFMIHFLKSSNLWGAKMHLLTSCNWKHFTKIMKKDKLRTSSSLICHNVSVVCVTLCPGASSQQHQSDHPQPTSRRKCEENVKIIFCWKQLHLCFSKVGKGNFSGCCHPIFCTCKLWPNRF